MSEVEYHKKVDTVCEQVTKLTILVEAHINDSKEREKKIDELVEFWTTLTYGRKFVIIIFGFVGGILGGLGAIIGIVWGIINILDKVK